MRGRARAARTVAQAKINLFLHVLARESSGYHTLETLFQRIDLGDDVVVRTDVSGRSLDCRGAELGPVEHNLAWRAADAFAREAGWPDGFAIEIEKRIPVGGGLGGGSADAGAVLRVLNALAPTPLPSPRLLQVAVGLGADVPFLASDAVRALGWGRGERLLALPPLPAREVGLFIPDVGVSTADAFRWLAEARGDVGPVARQLDLASLGDWGAIAAIATNDFERAVADHLPGVAWPAGYRDRLKGAQEPGDAPPSIVMMTGSGSTWFLISADESDASYAAPPERWRIVPTRTATRVAPIEPIA
ncbi:MAG TPA: 4-(cytidine 5'-diphospho)-2-C-methyl-D-erythritol kinase [Gemmatimonadales bacterium]